MNDFMTCPSDDELLALADRQIDPALRIPLHAHLEACAQCRRTVSALARLDERAGDVAGGESTERYVELRPLGQGGVGVVTLAYDTRLQRHVAIKRLAMPSSAPGGAWGRLFREARVMARLTHPNVVRIYDVSEHGDEIFIAMEPIDGLDLASWAQRRHPSWREILRTLVAAGRGIAAAHERGVIHRDIKPSNILIATDARVLVTDFGLALGPPDPSVVTSGTAVGSAEQTRAAGTPGYMAPEQYAAGSLDFSTDQFGFAATAWRILYGVLPYGVGPVPEPESQAWSGTIASPTMRVGPLRLERVLGRALALRPEQRFSTLTDLLAQLDRLLARRSRRLAIVSVSVLLATGASLGGFWAQQRPQCRSGDDYVGSVWTDERRGHISGALEDASVRYGFERSALLARLDEHATEIGTRLEQVCRTRYDGTISDAEASVREICLLERRAQLDALSSALAAADSSLARIAPSLVTEVRDPAECFSPESRFAVPSPASPAVAGRVEEVRRDLQRASYGRMAGKLDDAEKTVEGVAEVMRVETLEFAPLEAELALARARVVMSQGQPVRARGLIEEAIVLGDTVRHDEVSLDARLALVETLAEDPSRIDETLRWARVLEGLIRRAGHPLDTVARLKGTVAHALSRAERLDDALQHVEAGLAVLPESSYPLVRARLHEQRAAVFAKMGDFESARRDFDAAVELFGASLGVPAIPNVLPPNPCARWPGLGPVTRDLPTRPSFVFYKPSSES